MSTSKTEKQQRLAKKTKVRAANTPIKRTIQSFANDGFRAAASDSHHAPFKELNTENRSVLEIKASAACSIIAVISLHFVLADCRT
jgi:hypothetical protein